MCVDPDTSVEIVTTHTAITAHKEKTEVVLVTDPK
jgi:hypothetical protein